MTNDEKPEFGPTSTMHRSKKFKATFYILLFSAMLLVVVACIIGLILLLGSVTGRNYEKIRSGMPLSEVVAILGPPSDDVPPLDHEDIRADESDLMNFPPPHALHFWEDGSHMICVIVDAQERVASKTYSRSSDAGWFRRVCDSLGL